MYLSRDSFIEETLTTMLYRIFDLSYSKLKNGIDDEPLQRLLHGHEVVSRQERFHFHDGLPAPGGLGACLQASLLSFLRSLYLAILL